MTDQTDRLIRAPWTPEQVAALNAFQQRGGMHPFTCGGDHAPGSPVLVAHEDGWRCSDPYREGCDYRQDWAHAFMVERGHAAVSAGQAPATDRTALRERIAQALADATGARWPAQAFLTEADAVLAVLPETTDRAAVLREAAAIAEGQRQFEPAYGARWAAQVSENLGCLRVADELRRLADAPAAAVSGRAADETAAKPWQSDSARIGRTLIWSWSEIGKGAYGEGYRAAQAEARALLGGQRGTDAEAPAVGGAQPKEAGA
ncbi:hypothetical protein OG342_07090 [Streptomyces bobili]|uniref:hypothetical protein n=1 Tax=Streptomyces bobili TaxID=67280 RepID=UPI00224DEE8A|nr:hypothetical protein [Streptomyces bobili]MCX5522629.1 hypothetical protein [Streptomyces bobili]